LSSADALTLTVTEMTDVIRGKMKVLLNPTEQDDLDMNETCKYLCGQMHF
jgi:hypothetical protein